MKCPTCGAQTDPVKLIDPPTVMFEDIYRLRCGSVGTRTPMECRVADGTETSDPNVLARLPHSGAAMDDDCKCVWVKHGTRMRVVNRE